MHHDGNCFEKSRLSSRSCDLFRFYRFYQHGERAAESRCPDGRSEESLNGFLKTLDDDRTTRYALAFRDLNNDGIPEAIVYLVGKKWCGSGGCNTLVLAREGRSWRIVSNIRITRPPIYVLQNTANGWRSIAVWIQGGGIRAGYEAELRFDGKTYPKNPSAPPAQRLKGKPMGEEIIHSAQDVMPLYDEQPSARP